MDADKPCQFTARLAVPASALFILLSHYYYYYYYCVGGNLRLSAAVPGHNCPFDVFSQITGPKT